MHKLTSNNVAIIGSGVAGMATAIRLQLKGYKVTVYEANNYPGGKLSAFKQDGFSFDAGPSLFTQPQNIESLFELANKNIKDYFTYESYPIACKYFFANGKIVNAFTDTNLFATEMENELNEPKENILNYLKKSEILYNNVGKIYLNYSLKISKLIKAPIIKAIKNTKLKYVFSSLNKYNEANFKQPETIQLFNRYATYNGSNPFKAPAMLSVIPHLEMSEGTYYPNGGMISITNALVKLAEELGVCFKYKCKVNKIITQKNKAIGISVNNENIFYNYVVSNMDAYLTYDKLLNKKHDAAKILKQERSSSAFIFYWGINKKFDELSLHNILFSGNYKKEFNEIFKLKKTPSEPTIYINITSKCEENMAIPNGENWFVMINTPSHNKQDWEKQSEQLKSLVLKIINNHLQVNIEEHIVTSNTLSPLDIEQKTCSYKGSLYGTSSNSKLAAFFRHGNDSKVKNLFFCGGSVHPGGGIPLCFKSAKLVAENFIALN